MSAVLPPLVLLRHGHTEGNLGDRFTGRTDIPFTATGLAGQAEIASGMPLVHRFSAEVAVLERRWPETPPA
jgi:broad specificity phosphatase PhoE